eukprot:2485244-Pleurochrysis_carterae.AAC.2
MWPWVSGDAHPHLRCYSDAALGLVYLGPAPMSLSSMSRAHASAALPPPQVPEDKGVDYEESEPDASGHPAAAPDPSCEARPIAASGARSPPASKTRSPPTSKARSPAASKARPLTASEA